MHLFRKSMFLFLFLSASLSAYGIEEEAITLDEAIIEEEVIKGSVEREYMTGNWLGLREKLQERGLDIQSSYTVTGIQSIPSSTTLSRRSRLNYKGLFNLSGELDTKKAGLWKGGKFYVLYQAANKGFSPNDSLGTYMTIDSTDTLDRPISQLSEYWFEQEIGKKLSLKLGKQDANVDFQNIDGGFEYVNLSFSYIPTTPIPFYPSGQMGARLKYKINDLITLQNGFYSGSSRFGSSSKSFFKGDEGYFNITEAALSPVIKNKEGRYLFGGWTHTKEIEKLTGGIKDNNFGFYAMAEQKIYAEKADENQGLSLIAQGGWTPKDRNEVNKYYGLGLLYRGLIPKRDNDTTGVGLAAAGFSNESQNRIRKTENLLEIFYKFQVTKWLSIQPDFQYLLNPNSASGSAFALGIRTNITF